MTRKSFYNNIQNYNDNNTYLIKDLKYYYEKDYIFIEYYLKVK